MKKTLIIAVLVLVAAVFGGFQSARAQGSMAISESQFNAGLGAPFTLNWQIDGGITFTENGQTTYTTSSPMEYGSTSAEWTMSYAINNGTVTVTAQSSAFSGAYDWQQSEPIGSTSPIMSLNIGNSYGADNGESISISGITVNGGDPVEGNPTITADSSQSFSGFLITDSTPITSFQYTLDDNTPSTWERMDGDLSSTVEISPAPEPTILAFAGLGCLCLVYLRRWMRTSSR